jgi:hypothetical protein
LVAAPVFEFSLGAFQAAAIGAIPAALAVVKGILAGHIGNKETPALLPFKYDDFGLLTVNNNNWQDWQKFAIDPQPTVEVEVDGGLDEG